jgi:UDP-3-O-[3-hydroxymyristoyl] N-acetylglucosamine deacetylase
MIVNPASAEHGIWFTRTDLTTGDRMVPARWDNVIVSPLCTKIVNNSDVSVSTIEHIMAALAGCGVHNALIEINGPEVPILDGSSAQFVRGLVECGLQRLNAPVRAIEVLKPVEVRQGQGFARFEVAPTLQIDFEIEFVDAAIGHQQKTLNMANGAFVRELADSRTFCRQADVDAMRANGLALGGDLNNAVVVEGSAILTPGGLRHSDEAVRHKMLDALGDIFTAGAPVLGRYVGYKSGHAMTNALLRSLFADPSAYRMVVCSEKTASTLPGAGVKRADLLTVD